MTRFVDKLAELGGISLLAGAAIAACFVAFVPLPSLRGPQVIPFLAYFTLAAIAYLIAVLRLARDRIPLGLIWGSAILFRLILLLTSPSLSDDVYRYIWDGHLLNQGLNPYALPVNSPQLDAYTIPSREMVNNAWMASPYLSTAQGFFAIVTRIAPASPLAFQVSAVFLDLAAGWLVMDLLRQLGLPRRRVLLYLWNPLVAIEFAHSAHLDAGMIFLTVLAFWFLVKAEPDSPREGRYLSASALTLALATLTKFVPVLLIPLFLRRWRWKRGLLYTGVLLLATAPFVLGAGWGLSGQLDGRGIFGATRIYTMYWNFNSSLYHWLEVGLSGYPTPGGVPVEVVGERSILVARGIVSGLMALVELVALVWAWRLDDPDKSTPRERALNLLRLAPLPLGAYLLLTPTVHPWYVTILIPFIPFLLPQEGKSSPIRRFAWPLLYLSIAVAFSYLTYLDPENLREYAQVRWVEYFPLFGLLGWAIGFVRFD